MLWLEWGVTFLCIQMLIVLTMLLLMLHLLVVVMLPLGIILLILVMVSRHVLGWNCRWLLPFTTWLQALLYLCRNESRGLGP